MKEPLLKFAKSMRRLPTDAEALLWKHLRGGRLIEFKFKRQQPIGEFIVDFVCFERRLVVEVDGGQHQIETDSARTQWLQGQGFTILRFWNNEILRSSEEVLESIIRALRESPSPQPLSREGRGAKESALACRVRAGHTSRPTR
jgi:very-short-patch-repair endonuclease